MTDKPSDDKAIENKQFKHKPINTSEIINYIKDYAPLVEDLSKDQKFPDEKLQKECAALLEIKQKCIEDKDYIKKHEHDWILGLSIYRNCKAIVEPFTEKLTERTVNDIKAATNSNNWNEVFRDLGFLDDLNQVRVRKFPLRASHAERAKAADLKKLEYQEINKQLHASNWLPDVTLEGFYLQMGKNLHFTVKGETVYIYRNGMRVTAATEPDESFQHYLEKREIWKPVPDKQVEKNKDGITVEENQSAPAVNNIDQLKPPADHRE